MPFPDFPTICVLTGWDCYAVLSLTIFLPWNQLPRLFRLSDSETPVKLQTILCAYVSIKHAWTNVQNHHLDVYRTMTSLVAILDLKGKPLIQRSYRDDVPSSCIERFLPLVLEIEEEGQQVTPCFSNQGINYMHIRHSNLYRE
jgi:hypothetical protein